MALTTSLKVLLLAHSFWLVGFHIGPTFHFDLSGFLFYIYHMKVELIKHHELGVEGQHLDVTKERGEYLIRVGAAKLVEKKETKVSKQPLEKK